MRSFLAGVAAAVLLTGCGTALARSGTGHSGGGPRTAVVVTGSRAQAQAYVRHLMAELSLPASSVPAHVRSLPQIARARAPGGPGWAGASRILIVPGQPLAVLQRISAHAPFNEPVTYSATPVLSSTMRPAPEPGIDAVILDLAVQAHSRTTTLVAAYAFAAWLPSRTAAEYLDPDRFRAVTISASQLVSRPHQVTGTFTSAAVIARLAAFLNGRPPAPASALASLSCPTPLATVTLRFTATGRQAPAVTVSAAGCMADVITVNRRQQPLLWDTAGNLESMARKLLGLA
jgi:uncharacterized protein YceK